MSWLTISQTSGEGDAEITLSASSHTELEQRVASLKVYGQKAYAIETVMQKADEGFIVDPTSLTFDYKSGTQEISITANTSWQIYVDEGTYALSETAHTFSDTAETITITVTSDYDWTVSSEDDWITVTKGDGSFTVAVAENTGDTRNGTVTLYNYLGNVGATLAISQNDALSKTITYTSTDGNIVTPYPSSGITSNTYEDGVGRIILRDTSNIGTLSFYTRTTLATITYPSTSFILDGNSLYNCSALTSVDLGGATKIGDYALYSCGSLTSVTMSNVTSIGESAFGYCEALTSVTIPSVTTIGTSAFRGCSALTSVTIPNVTTIGEYTFYECTSLTSVTVPNVTTIGTSAFGGCSALTSIELPNVVSIGGSAFGGCDALTSIELPNVTTMGGGVFYNCSALTSATMPNVTTIGEYAFSFCKALTSATMPNVTTIGDEAFSFCDSLTYMDLGKLESLGNSSIVCRSLSTIYVRNNTAPSLEGLTLLVASTGTLYYPQGADYSSWLTKFGSGWTGVEEVKVFYTSTDGEVVTPTSSSGIVSNTYYNGVGTITFSDASNIGTLSFNLCTTLATITFPSVSVALSKKAFYNCTSLTTVDLGGVTEIGESAFANCSALTSIDLTAVTTIGKDAFGGCDALTSIELPAVTSIGDNAFQSCSALTSIELPLITSIGTSGFAYCYGLTRVVLGGEVALGNNAFYKCNSLTYMDLGYLVKIGSYSVVCPSLSTIYVRSSTVPGSDMTTFSVSSAGTFYYPKNSGYSDWLNWFGSGWTGVEIEL